MTMTHITKATTVARGEIQGLKVELILKPGYHRLVRTVSAYVKVNGQSVRINKNTTALAIDNMDQYVAAAKAACNLVAWD